MPEFIIEHRGHENPRIMRRRDNGTYEAIGMGYGHDKLDDLLALVTAANAYPMFEEE